MNALTKTEAHALSEQSTRVLNDIIERDAIAAAETRSRAAASILASMKWRKRTAKAPTARELLHQVRYSRHGF